VDDKMLARSDQLRLAPRTNNKALTLSLKSCTITSAVLRPRGRRSTTIPPAAPAVQRNPYKVHIFKLQYSNYYIHRRNYEPTVVIGAQSCTGEDNCNSSERGSYTVT